MFKEAKPMASPLLFETNNIINKPIAIKQKICDNILKVELFNVIHKPLVGDRVFLKIIFLPFLYY